MIKKPMIKPDISLEKMRRGFSPYRDFTDSLNDVHCSFPGIWDRWTVVGRNFAML